MMSYSQQRSFFAKMVVLFVGIFLISSCEKKEPVLNHPLSVDIFHSTDGLQAAFTALTHSAVSWEWDFGDGATSTEKDPVHEYDEGGYYLVTLTAKDGSGNSVTDEVTLALDLTPFDLLVGDYTRDDYQGKTWKLSATHGSNDKIVNSDADLSLFDSSIPELPSGAFGLFLNLPQAYNDEFTFFEDGRYEHNTTDGESFGGIVFASVLAGMGVTDITAIGGKDALGEDAFAMTTYSPDDEAKYKFVENEDFAVPTIPDFATGINDMGIPTVTYSDVMTIDFPGSDEFIGVRDFHQKVMVEHLSNNSMRLVMFLTLSPDPDLIVSEEPLIALSTTALILSFEVVN